MADIFCNPDICPNCQYIGEGDSICDETLNVVLADWEPTDDFMRDCPLMKKRKKHKSKRRRRKK